MRPEARDRLLERLRCEREQQDRLRDTLTDMWCRAVLAVFLALPVAGAVALIAAACT